MLPRDVVVVVMPVNTGPVAAAYAELNKHPSERHSCDGVCSLRTAMTTVSQLPRSEPHLVQTASDPTLPIVPVR